MNPLAKRTSMVECAGGGTRPQLKITFDSVTDMQAASDFIRTAHEPATALGVAPIARIEIIGGEVSQTEVYAPGLPDGAHDLFPVPLNPAGELRPFLSSSPPPSAAPLERTLQRVMGRLADLLCEDDFNNIEAIVREGGVGYPPSIEATDAARAVLTKRASE